MLLSDLDELTIPELIDEFEFLGDWEDQCRYLIELGEQLPDLDPSERTEAFRVHGCQSRVWLVPEPIEATPDPIIRFHAKSDARIVDGLIVVVSLLFNGKHASEILKADVKEVFTRLGLESQLVPQRRNGLYAMVDRVMNTAKRALSSSANSDARSSIAPTTPSVSVKSSASHSATSSTAPDKTFDAAAFRAQFPALAQTTPSGKPIVFLDSAASSQKPQCVIDKELEVYSEYYANAYRGVYRFGDRVSRELESSREKARKLIGADSSEEIVFTSGSTMGMNLIAYGWGRKFLKPGDEIILTLLEHHANIVPWQFIAQQTGATVRFLPLNADGTLDESAFDDFVTDRAKVVSVTGLSNVLGTVPPLELLSRKAREVGALFIVDGAQSVPHSAIDVVGGNIDFLVFSGHKLYGPSGVGILYGRKALLEAMDPFLCGGHMISEVTVDGFTTSPVPAKFEAGTLPIAQAIALGTAIDFVTDVGLDALHRHETELLDLAWERMSQIPGVRLFGPRTPDRGAIIPFTIEGAAAQDIAGLLDLHGVCVRHGHHCTMPLHDWLKVPATVRLSFAGYNNADEVESLVAALDDVRATLKLK